MKKPKAKQKKPAKPAPSKGVVMPFGGGKSAAPNYDKGMPRKSC